MKASYLIWFLCSLFSPLMVNSQTSQLPDLEAYRNEWTGLRPELDKNIERYRKGDAVIELVDKEGNPIKKASIYIKQKSHDFIFGCNSLVIGQLGEMNEDYEQAFAKLFNLATTTFTFSEYSPEPGKYRFGPEAEDVWRRPVPDKIVEFGKKNGIRIKGQPLLKDSYFPKWGKGMSADQARDLYVDFFKEISKRYSKDFYMFDLVNESLIAGQRSGSNFPLYTPELDFVGWAFETAKSIFPDKPPYLAINEGLGGMNGNIAKGENRYYNQLKGLFEKGSGKFIDGIGFQFHLYEKGIKDHLGLTMFTPSHLLEAYNAFSIFNRPLYISEITIPSTYIDGPEGEKIQAEVVANLYRLWFSVESMAGIIWWNLCDGAAFKSEAKDEGRVLGGLLDENMREKPAYQALYQLIQREWKTRLTSVTDDQGIIKFRGFYGRYDVTVTAGEKSQTFEIDLLKEGRKTNRLTLM